MPRFKSSIPAEAAAAQGQLGHGAAAKPGVWWPAEVWWRGVSSQDRCVSLPWGHCSCKHGATFAPGPPQLPGPAVPPGLAPKSLSPAQCLLSSCFKIQFSQTGKNSRISKFRIFSYGKNWILWSSKFSAREGRPDVSVLKQDLLCIHRRNVLYIIPIDFLCLQKAAQQTFSIFLLLVNSLVMNTNQLYL